MKDTFIWARREGMEWTVARVVHVENLPYVTLPGVSRTFRGPDLDDFEFGPPVSKWNSAEALSLISGRARKKALMGLEVAAWLKAIGDNRRSEIVKQVCHSLSGSTTTLMQAYKDNMNLRRRNDSN